MEDYKYFYDKVNQTLKIKVKIKEVGPDIQIYWTPNQGFGGIVKRYTEDAVIILDSGCDGNTYTDREVDKEQEVWIEIPTKEIHYVYRGSK
jgi:hypothetical protein